jgi:hypothetical protein
MPKFVLLLRDQPAAFENLGPEDIQKIIEKYQAWSERVAARGALVQGEKLSDSEGRVLRLAKSGLEVKDGPFLETKEIVGGFYVLRAKSYQEVVELCRDHPQLAFGSIEIREIDAMGKPQD